MDEQSVNIARVCGVYVVQLCLIVIIIAEKRLVLLVTLKWNTHSASVFYKLHILPIYHLNACQVGCFVYGV